MISNRVIPSFFLAYSLLGAGLAIFAHQLGIDPNPGWGTSRIILLMFSVALFCFSFYLFSGKLSVFIRSDKTKIIIVIGHIWVIIFIIYAWFITFGNMTTWTSTTRRYTLLADALIKGQLYVDIEPGMIAEAKDPYNIETRPPFKEELWDLSLYKEKLYLYWGPIPAILIIPIQIFTKLKIADIYLVYFFVCALLIINTLLLLKLWKLFFADISPKYISQCIFVLGLNLPILWIINKPEVYETALSAGQFFLISAIYFIIFAIETDIKKKHLFLAGLCMACSVGSRAINFPSVIFLTIVIFFWILKHHKQPGNWNNIIQPFAILLTPLLLAAILIGYYNWARFESPFEFGLRYQLTLYNLNRDIGLTFLPDYFPLNFYGYIFQPFQWISKFPFIQPAPFLSLITENIVDAPKLYASNRVIGVLFYAPFLMLAFVPFFSRFNHESKNKFQKIILFILGGSFLINFVSILFFFFGEMRYLVDLISQITFLAIMGYWLLIRKYQTSKIIPQILNLVIAFTLITSLLLSFTSEKHRMLRLNPKLIDRINSFFIWEQ